jgi:hypothetical protein
MPTKKKSTTTDGETVKKEFKVAGDKLMATVKKLLHEGNVRRISIKNKGRTLLEIPLTAGVAVGALAIVITPILAAVGAVAALVSDVTIVVEKVK